MVVAIFLERLKAAELWQALAIETGWLSLTWAVARDVAPRPAPLSSGRRLNYFLADCRETTRHPWFARFQTIVALPSSSNPHPTETRRSSPFHSLNSAVIGFGSSIFPFG